MDRPISSEEKLLNFIRRKNPLSPSKEKKASSGKDSDFAAKAGYVKGSVYFLKLLNKFLGLLAVIFIGYLVYKGFVINQNESVDLPVMSVPETEIRAVTPASYQIKPLSYYTDLIDQRDIFNTSFEKPKAEKSVVAVLQTIDPMKNLRLVGVVLAETPQAIVEDLDAKETVFLAKGDAIKEMVLEDIQETKIILNYQGQRFELTNEVRQPGQ